MSRKFTLIELVVVIAVIGILSSIIIPNISDIKRKGESVAITSNVRNLQTITDMYSVDKNGSLPVITEPDMLMPESVDFTKIYPEYERNLPKTKKAKYWIDANGEVWGSEADSPTGFIYDENTHQVSWSKRIDAIGYQVYEVVKRKSSSSINTSMFQYKPVGEPITDLKFEGKEGKTYAVSSIDDMGHISAPIGTGTYIEYIDTLESIKKGQSNHKNQPPIARISVLPSTIVDTNTTLNWDYSNSFDPDGDKIVDAEWKNKKDQYSTEGTYLVELRVKDEAGNWSEWTSASIEVSRVDTKPIASFTFTPVLGITSETTVTFDSSSSNDTDGDSIVAYEWQVDNNPVTSPNGVFTAGNHTIKLRVQDSRGNWSEFVEHSLSVEATNHAPTTTITRTPSGSMDTNTAVTFTNTFNDVDGDTQQHVEWKVDGVIGSPNQKYTAGSHTVEVRVQDSKGLWSNWVTHSFNVSTPNQLPTAIITMTPNTNIDSNTTITWSYSSSTDDKGIVSAEWQIDSNAIQTTEPNGKLSAGTHTVKLRVKDTDGAWSDWVSQSVTVNAAVTIAATASDMMSVSLTFSNVGSGTFKLYRNGTLVRSFASTTTTYTDTGLLPTTTYSYYITVQNDTIQSNTVSRATTSAPECPKDGSGHPYVPNGGFDGYNSGTIDSFSLNVHKCAYPTNIELRISHISFGTRTQVYDITKLTIGTSIYGSDYMLVSGIDYVHPYSGQVNYTARMYVPWIQPYYSYVSFNTRGITAN